MHSAMYFLLDNCEPEDAIDVFTGEMGGYLDENNWWSPVLLTGPGYCFKYTRGSRWDDVHNLTVMEAARWALEGVIRDAGLWGTTNFSLAGAVAGDYKIADVPSDVLYEECIKHLKAEIAQAYGDLNLSGDPSDIRFSAYTRQKAVKCLETLLVCDTPPFTWELQPVYDWGCFDLAGTGLTGASAILMVDIHT